MQMFYRTLIVCVAISGSLQAMDNQPNREESLAYRLLKRELQKRGATDEEIAQYFKTRDEEILERSKKQQHQSNEKIDFAAMRRLSDTLREVQKNMSDLMDKVHQYHEPKGNGNGCCNEDPIYLNLYNIWGEVGNEMRIQDGSLQLVDNNGREVDEINTREARIQSIIARQNNAITAFEQQYGSSK